MASPEPPGAADRPRGRRIARILLVWLIILAAGLAGCELLARSSQGLELFSFPLAKVSPYYSAYDEYAIWNRAFAEERPSYFTGWPHPPALFNATTPYPRYVYKPNLTLAVQGGRLVPARPGDAVYWSTNALGLRGEDIAPQKPPGTIRIVCLGASTTEGTRFDNETYPYYLQQELRERYPGRQIEVINAGHHAYRAQDNLALLRTAILPLRPDLILWYEAGNDINVTEFSFTLQDLPCWRDGTCHLAGTPPGYGLLYRNAALFRLLADRFSPRTVPPALPHTFDASPPPNGAAAWAATLREMAAAAREAHTPIAFLSFVTIAHEGLQPDPAAEPLLFDHVYRTYYPLTPGEIAAAYAVYNTASRKVAAEEGLPFYDIAAEFPRDPAYFPADYIHLTPEGNRLLAHLVAGHLANETGLF